MGCFTCLKMMMFGFNGVIFLGGAAVLGIGIWVKVDGNSFMKILGTAAPQLTQLTNMGFVCIGVGCFLLLMGFLGCWGTMKESKCLLLLFFVIVLIIFIVEVSGAVVVLAFSAVADIFIDYFKNWALKTLKEDYGKQKDITAIWDTTMKELKCCGFYNYTDFDNTEYLKVKENFEYPAPCCKTNQDCQIENIDLKKQGCLREAWAFLKKNGRIVGGVAIGIGLLEMAAMAVSLILFSQIKTTSS